MDTLTFGLMLQNKCIRQVSIGNLSIDSLGLSSRITIRVTGIPIPQSKILLPAKRDVANIVGVAAGWRSQECRFDTKNP